MCHKYIIYFISGRHVAVEMFMITREVTNVAEHTSYHNDQMRTMFAVVGNFIPSWISINAAVAGDDIF